MHYIITAKYSSTALNITRLHHNNQLLVSDDSEYENANDPYAIIPVSYQLAMHAVHHFYNHVALDFRHCDFFNRS